MKTTFLKWMLGLFMLLVAAHTTSATWVTIQIEGVVDNVIDYGNYLEGKLNVGDPITGWYTYDTSTSDTNPSQYVGDYWHYNTPAGILLTAGGFEFKTDQEHVQFLLEVVNAGGPYTMDNYLLRSYNNMTLSNNVAVGHISWQLDDTTGTALGDTTLSNSPPTLLQWQTNVLRLEGDRTFLVQGHVTSAVPEPATLSLIALGALGTTFRRTSKH